MQVLGILAVTNHRVLQVKTSKALCMLANAFFDCNTLFSINRSTAIILENKSASQAREVPAFLPSSPYHYIPPSPHSLLPRHLWVLHLWFQYRSRWCHRTRESTGYSRFLCISQLPSGLHPSTVQKQKSGSVSEGKKQLHSHHYLAQQLKEKHHQDYFFIGYITIWNWATASMKCVKFWSPGYAPSADCSLGPYESDILTLVKKINVYHAVT